MYDEEWYENVKTKLITIDMNQSFSDLPI